MDLDFFRRCDETLPSVTVDGRAGTLDEFRKKDFRVKIRWAVENATASGSSSPGLRAAAALGLMHTIITDTTDSGGSHYHSQIELAGKRELSSWIEASRVIMSKTGVGLNAALGAALNQAVPKQLFFRHCREDPKRTEAWFDALRLSLKDERCWDLCCR